MKRIRLRQLVAEDETRLIGWEEEKLPVLTDDVEEEITREEKIRLRKAVMKEEGAVVKETSNPQMGDETVKDAGDIEDAA